MSDIPVPLPLFDSIQHISSQSHWPYLLGPYDSTDIEVARRFLMAYQGSSGTFNAYRREIERFLHWMVLVESKKLSNITRADIERFVSFCQNPPKTWIGDIKHPRFLEVFDGKVPNIQ